LPVKYDKFIFFVSFKSAPAVKPIAVPVSLVGAEVEPKPDKEMYPYNNS
jgi:hypothetical protein